ncbi:MAG: ferrous iron transport protein B [Desulfomonilaceae bacterium]|nr:ferrous iron transport protein B [Desulfomonilaceae bacterium]
MKQQAREVTVALAGQPNSGKSTVFNMLTGARQHVANYPGVTVEKKWGSFATTTLRVRLVDLPGTYSLTSYTQEERIARDFILTEKPEALVAVVDASNLERSLYLVFQLREMDIPIVLCLNMMDTAKSRGLAIDLEVLEHELDMPVVPTVGKKGLGKRELVHAVERAVGQSPRARRYIRYDAELESFLERLDARLEESRASVDSLPRRWLTVKLMENDEEARKRLVGRHEVAREGNVGDLVEYVDFLRREYIESFKRSPEKSIAAGRYHAAGEIVARAIEGRDFDRRSVTDRIDSIVLQPILAPIILAGILLTFYQATMVYGTVLADRFFPALQEGKEIIAGLFAPTPDLIRSGLLQGLVLDGLVGGVIAILYYVPIFLILFGCIAILEDSGYMPRMAFIMDRILRSFGLHGQSTLPLILGGVVVGGCAVPGVMATRAMKDEKARLITILIMPLMNCLAKIPFYVLIVGLFFSAYQGLVLFGISLFGFFVALLIAKLFSSYLVRGESAPFVMELPAYHVPTIRGVLSRAVERVWLFIRKIVTIVAVVMVGVWFFVTFPGIGFEREMHYDARLAEAEKDLYDTIAPSNRYARYLSGDSLVDLMHYRDGLNEAQRNAGEDAHELKEVERTFSTRNPAFFALANNGVTADGMIDPAAREAASKLKRFERKVRGIKRERRKEIIDASWAGRVGRSLEPVSMWAGFNWRINIAIISSFAAKESLVGTLGTIYSFEEGSQAGTLEQSIRRTESGWTVWHGLAVLVFVALFPPCLATLIMIRHETQSTGWMIFATIYPIVTGFILACLVFQLGPLLI